MTTILAVVGDTHSNSTVGVNPPEVVLDGGDTWVANRTNRWRWQCWNDYWDKIEKVQKAYMASLYVVFNGDSVDDPFHPTTEIISTNKATALDIARSAMERPAKMADKLFLTRGTVAHTGKGCWMEEELANDFEAEPDPEAKTFSWYHLPLICEQVYFDIAHHPKTTGRLPWTESGAPGRQGAHILHRKVSVGHTVPDVILRSHHHGNFQDSGMGSVPRTFYLRPWQTMTAFGHRIGESGTVIPIGGVCFVVDGEDYTVRDIKYVPKEREPWTE